MSNVYGSTAVCAHLCTAHAGNVQGFLAKYVQGVPYALCCALYFLGSVQGFCPNDSPR